MTKIEQSRAERSRKKKAIEDEIIERGRIEGARKDRKQKEGEWGKEGGGRWSWTRGVKRTGASPGS